MYILGTDPLCLLLVSGIARLGFPRRESPPPGPPLIIRTGGVAVPTTVALISALTKLDGSAVHFPARAPQNAKAQSKKVGQS